MPRRPHEKLPIHCYICKVLDVFHETFHPNKTPSLRLRHFDGKVYIWEIGRHLLLKDKPISPDLDEECENLKLEDSNKLVRKWDDGNRHVSLFEITSTTEPTVRDDEDVHCKICRCTAEHHERWTQECAGVVEVDHFSSYRCIWYIGSKAVLKDKIFDAQNGDEETPLNYVRNRTKIPVPSWMRCWHEGHRVLIFMERVPGQTLDEAHLYGSLTKDERAMIDKEVDGYIQELRQLQAPQAGLPNGQQIYNRPFWTPVRRTHWLLPPTHEEAKEDWYQKSLSGVGPSEKAKLDELKDRFPASEPYTFTHGDLDTSNIMVQDGHVTGIIDWEGSGFAPVCETETPQGGTKANCESSSGGRQILLDTVPTIFQVKQR